jgi:uncharacterized protein (TIRG00374 family)
VTAHAASRTGALALAKVWLPRLVAVGLLVWSIQRAGLENVVRSLAAADGLSIAVAVALVIPFLWARAARWRVILSDLGIDIGLALACRLYAVGLFFGTVTPGQAGDALKAWFLSRRGHSLALSLLSCVLDRLFDVFVLAAIATTALVVFWPNEQTQWVVGATVVVGVLAMLVFLTRPAVRVVITRLPLVRLVWSPLERRVRRFDWGPPLLDSGLRSRTLAVSLALTVVGFAVTMSRVYLTFHAVGVDLPPLTFLAVASVTVFASLISVAGVGSRDIALIAMFAPFGYSEQQAVAASFLILFLTFTNVVPGFVVWLTQDDIRTSSADLKRAEVEPVAPSVRR